jgi:hypothetical protein
MQIFINQSIRLDKLNMETNDGSFRVASFWTRDTLSLVRLPTLGFLLFSLSSGFPSPVGKGRRDLLQDVDTTNQSAGRGFPTVDADAPNPPILGG